MARCLKTNPLKGICSLSVEIEISVDCTRSLNRSEDFFDLSANSRFGGSHVCEQTSQWGKRDARGI